jgi:hypothetical protein
MTAIDVARALPSDGLRRDELLPAMDTDVTGSSQ